MKLTLKFDYDPKAETLAESFGITEDHIREIGKFIDELMRNGITASNLLNKCVEKFKHKDLLVAIALVWNVCMMDVRMQMEIADAIMLARTGGRMPKEIQ